MKGTVGEFFHRYGIVGQSRAIANVIRVIELVSVTRSTVLITGETGTGKELVARAVHTRSALGQKPFIKVNCAAIPDTLLESELFGHVKGAFTDATSARKGKFSLANHGSIFLDEIGTMNLALQAKLLRVLQEREVEPLGSERTEQVDVRVIAATNRDLRQLVNEGRFQQDLFYRLNVVPIHIPPLRERREDIPLLADHFIAKFNDRLKKEIAAITPEAVERLVAYQWPGNIRELENLMERTVLFCEGPEIRVSDLPPEVAGAATPHPVAATAQAAGEEAPRPAPESLKEAVRAETERVERELIQRALDATGGNVTQAARKLKISRKSLQTKMKELGLREK